MLRPKVVRFPVVMTGHVFDKIRSIDVTLAEFGELINSGEVIEETQLDDGRLREVVLIVEWLSRCTSCSSLTNRARKSVS